jgi:formylglycine-generating enzyme required for sulfatase activity
VDGFNFWNPVDAIRGDKSPFGVVGMAGNVAEWVGTWDPVKKRPLIKGGSFMASDLRLDRSSDSDPNTLSESIGFRTVTHTAPVKK